MENTVPFKGDTKELPHCKLCAGEAEGENPTHEYMTYEHPYRMKTEEELKKGGEL